MIRYLIPICTLLLLGMGACTLYPKKPPAPEPPSIKKEARRKNGGRVNQRPAQRQPGDRLIASLPSPTSPSWLVDEALLKPYDPDKPCLSKGVMISAEETLFKSYPRPAHQKWLMGLNRAFYDLKIDCRDNDFLVMVLSIIQQESGVAIDPPLENTNLSELLDFRLQRLSEKNFLAAKMLNVSGIETALKEKLRKDNRKGIVKTEGDLGRYIQHNLRPWFKRLLVKQFSIPEPIARISAEIGISDPVSTIGPMQVNLWKAFRNSEERGEKVGSPNKMRRLLLNKKTALERGLLEGVYLLWKSYRFYRSHISREERALYSGADYNAGEFSSRNAAFQERVSILSRRELLLDGDLLLYRNGRPLTLLSNTERGVRSILSGMKPTAIRQDLLQEKTAAFISSPTVIRVCKRYRKVSNRPCKLARLPGGAGNQTAQVKHGRKYTPENYARAFLNRFKENRRVFFGNNGG